MPYSIYKVLISAFVLSVSVQAFGQHKIVLSTNFDGEVLSGSKDLLIEEIRKGKAVRVGYQLDFDEDKIADFDHWVSAEFITIINDEVFTQIRNINLQIPDVELSKLDIIPANTMWTAILGTDGLLKNRFVYEKFVPEKDEDGIPIMDKKMEKELKKREVKIWKVATFWAVDN